MKLGYVRFGLIWFGLVCPANLQYYNFKVFLLMNDTQLSGEWKSSHRQSRRCRNGAVSGSINCRNTAVSGSMNCENGPKNFWIQKLHKWCDLRIQKLQKNCRFWIQNLLKWSNRFMDPEMVEMVRFMDPEIVEMVDRSYIQYPLWRVFILIKSAITYN